MISSEHSHDEPPVQDCDCRRCAIAERDRLRDAVAELPEMLARHAVVDPAALSDPEGYDGGDTKQRIERVRQCILTPEPVDIGLREPQPRNCQCKRCLRERNEQIPDWPLEMMRMIVCSKCGNKRCPHANDHRHACTGSNDPGQPGSAY